METDYVDRSAPIVATVECPSRTRVGDVVEEVYHFVFKPGYGLLWYGG